MANFRRCLVCWAAAGVSLSVVGCGARYEVGQSAGSGGSGVTGGEVGTGSIAGGAPTGGVINQAGGAINQAGGATAVGGASTGLPACIQQPPLPSTFEPAEPIEMWRRLTTYFYSEPSPPPRDLPLVTSFAWIRETALKMLHGELSNQGLPPGSSMVLGQLIASWIPDRIAAFRYTEPLLADGATLSSLWWAPDPNLPHRIGLLTDPSLLASRPSISGRATWVMRQVFCLAVPLPPAGTELLPPPEQPGVTRRQELAEAVSAPTCAGCHSLIDPPGFSLEHFDAIGEFRTVDDGQPIDASGVLRVTNSAYEEVFAFSDVEDLAKQLPDSCLVGQCFSQKVWTDAIQRVYQKAAPEPRPGELDTVLLEFASDSYSIDALIGAIVTSPSFAESE